MTKKEIQINNTLIWLAIDNYIPLLSDSDSSVEESRFLCYYKLTEPNDIIHGELFRDSEGKPIIFTDIDEAVTKATEILIQKFGTV